MKKITPQEFLLRQPSYPEVTETDPFYLDLANRLLEESAKLPFASRLEEGVTRRIALCLTDYVQDITADAGLWRSFVDANRELYGWSVPFHDVPESYIDYELNLEDVRFLVWYVTAMLSDSNRYVYPHDVELLKFADKCHAILEEEYEEAPVPVAYRLARGLEFSDPEDHKAIYALGNWLFLHSYLLTPAYSESLREMMSELNPEDPDYASAFNKRLEEAEMQDTTGPLALFIPEWVYLIIERRLPDLSKSEDESKIHPYYEKFTQYTGGKTIQYFDSYEKMNQFFIDALGWAAGEEHLSQAKGAHDYVLMVTPHKGMLMARDVARCIKDPDNPYYNNEYASRHAFDLLVDRGLCPGDLLHKILNDNWLPDAAFPEVGKNVSERENRELVHANADFIARCFLQIYYRGD